MLKMWAASEKTEQRMAFAGKDDSMFG